MTTINKPMTGEQLDELMTIAVNMQRDSEKIGERSVAMFAYAVQVAVLEIHDVRSQLAESQSKLEKMAAENAGLKKYICDECYVENIKTGAAKCAGLGMPETPATDAFLAEVRAQGVEMAANMLNHNHPLMSEAADAILYHAAQLRQGAAK
ncbi:hypothetical protein [Lelliottia amnigena]|uniref:hypothetical protein n=1 Tax=Lelliottia amnigena TaxID=61646 RepID=UPI004056C466